MAKPVGGRGKRATYETTHVRVPVPIKAEVEKVISRFFEEEEQTTDKAVNNLDEAIVTARNILAQKKSARVSLQKLLTAIYGQDVEL